MANNEKRPTKPVVLLLLVPFCDPQAGHHPHASPGPCEPVRVKANGDVFHLATTREDLSAELIGLIYGQRWPIELFFKWIKTILHCRHWLAQSPAGVEIQVYCVLIASLLLMWWTGQRPNKRVVESLRYYWMGLATAEDLLKSCSAPSSRKNPESVAGRFLMQNLSGPCFDPTKLPGQIHLIFPMNSDPPQPLWVEK